MTIAIGSRVKETSTTTGTGNYTLLGADPDFRAISAIVTPGADALVRLQVYMGAEFEDGYYRLSAADTLVCVKIIESTNANAAVNWGAGEKTIICGAGALSAAQGKHNLTATEKPTTANNYTEGYGPGSLWAVLTPFGSLILSRLWVCLDAGIPSDSAATWAGLYTGAYPHDDGKLVEYLTSAVSRGGQSLGPNQDYTDPNVESSIGMGFGALIGWNNAIVQGIGWGTDIGEFERVISAGLYLETADATPTPMVNGTESGNNERAYLAIPINSAYSFTINVLAARTAGGDAKAWRFEFVVKRGAAGDPSLVGSITETVVAADAGAAAWDCNPGIDTTNDGIKIEAVGEAATTIRWSASVSAVKVAYA